METLKMSCAQRAPPARGRDHRGRGADRGGGNLAVLKKDEWNVLVDLIQSGQLSKV